MEKTYIISRDGKPCGIIEAAESMGPLAWFHNNVHGYSMDHAIQHEGYSVDERAPDCGEVEALIGGICERMGLAMEAAFVPFSQSRNAKAAGSRLDNEKPWESLNWRISLSCRGRAVLDVDYSQGTGLLPGASAAFGRNPSVDEAAAVKRAIEQGRWKGRLVPAPALGAVIHSLALDASAIDEPDFESWASSLGYDSDSRKAEASYRACLETATKLRAAIGEHGLAELRTAAQYN